MVRKIKSKLKNGTVTIGTWMQIPSSSVAEILGCSGYDWIAVDLEHGHFSIERLPEIFRAIELGGSIPFARVAESSKKDIKFALDAGAKGLILPMIESGIQLEEAIGNIYYPPKGNRGIGYSRTNLFGKNFDEYLEKDAKSIVVVAQIEHIKAVENLEEILSVDDLDAIMVGPYDLSGSMDLTGKFDHPDFLKTLQEIFTGAKKHKIPMGLHVVKPDNTLLEEKISEGYQFLAYGIDAVFLSVSCQNPYKTME